MHLRRWLHKARTLYFNDVYFNVQSNVTAANIVAQWSSKIKSCWNYAQETELNLYIVK